MMEESIIKYGAFAILAFFVIRELFGLIKRAMPKPEAIDDKLALKVDKEDCQPAMQRVGACIDKLEKINGKQSETIKGLEIGMAFLVGKMGGDYQTIKRNGTND